jgi:hypothetical protein
LLPERYYNHWLIFAKTASFLSCYSLKKAHLADLKQLLAIFVEQTEKLYGVQTLKINLHQLLHIIDRDVENWGLFWTHNAFIYESMNGLFTRFIHGTQHIPKAAIHTFSCMQQLPSQERQLEFSNLEAQSLFNKLAGDHIK